MTTLADIATEYGFHSIYELGMFLGIDPNAAQPGDDIADYDLTEAFIAQAIAAAKAATQQD